MRLFSSRNVPVTPIKRKMFHYLEPMNEGVYHSTVNSWLPIYLAQYLKSKYVKVYAEKHHLFEIESVVVLCDTNLNFTFVPSGLIPSWVKIRNLSYACRLIQSIYHMMKAKKEPAAIASIDYTLGPFVLLLLLPLIRCEHVSIVLHKPLKLIHLNFISRQIWKVLLSNNRIYICLLDKVCEASLPFIAKKLNVAPNCIVANAKDVNKPTLPEEYDMSIAKSTVPSIYCSAQDYDEFIRLKPKEFNFSFDPTKERLNIDNLRDSISESLFKPQRLYGKSTVKYLVDILRCDIVAVNASRERRFFFASGLRTDAHWLKKQILEF